MEKLKNLKEDGNPSEVIAEIFKEYMDLYPISCSELPNNSYGSHVYMNEKVVCLASDRNLNIGFYFDTNCNKSYDVIGYRQEDNILKNISNACGYIIYAPRKSEGIIGHDFFIIGLKKRSIK